MHANSSGGIIIALTIFFSMCLCIAPWPDQAAILMPNWTLLTLMYWSIALPHKISIFSGFIVGLLFDVLTGSLLGQQALIFSMTAFFCHSFYSRFRNYRIWQQSILILIFLVSIKLLFLWIERFTLHTGYTYQHGLQVLISSMSWPVVFASLRSVRRRFRVQ